MALDADLNSGAISFDEAQQQKVKLTEECDFFIELKELGYFF